MILEQFDQETVELVPDSIVMQSPKELTQYFIQSWSLTYKDMSKLLSNYITVLYILKTDSFFQAKSNLG